MFGQPCAPASSMRRLCLMVFATAQCHRVAVLTTSDCRSASPVTHHEFGTQLAASLVVLLRMRELFPGWDAFLATRPSKWNGSPGSNAAKDASCREVWDDLSGLYRERFGAELRLVNYDHRDFAMLDVVRCVETGGRESTPRRPPRHRADAVTRTTPRAGGVGADTRTRLISAQVVSRIPGKETDHSRGHWPSEAFVHLVIGTRMLEEYGYSHTVYVDADAWPLDDALRFEVPRVDGIGCVAALPAQCLEVRRSPRRRAASGKEPPLPPRLSLIHI